MKNSVANLGAIAFGASVMAQPISATEFSASKTRIKSE